MMKLSRTFLMELPHPTGVGQTPYSERQRIWGLAALSGMVERYHNVPSVTHDTVGEHTYGVMWLCVLLSEPERPSAELLLAALMHDTPEMIWGDITAPTKRALGMSRQYAELENDSYRKLGVRQPKLTDDERHTLKVADCLDGLLHCCYERGLGNQLVAKVYDAYAGYTAELIGDKRNQRHVNIFNHITDIWRTFDEGHK